MFCALSGQVPKEPVLSTKSGQLYEKSLILKYLQQFGKDPVDQQETSVEDLITIKSSNQSVAPKPPSATSIPSLLSFLQNEWDATMLEVYQMKQQYHALRQELSNALYENDAAKRVIARLIKERDEARIALQQVDASSLPKKSKQVIHDMDVDQAPPSHPQAQPTQEVEEEEEDLVVKEISARANLLSQGRRKRKPGPNVPTADEISEYKELSQVTSLHSATGGGGIYSLDFLNASIHGVDTQWAITGGKDGHAIVVNSLDGKILADVKAHTKKINTVRWKSTPSIDSVDGASFLTASADKTVKYWKLNEDYSHSKALYTFKSHLGEVTGLDIHPTNNYFATASLDSTWTFSHVENGAVVCKVDHADVDQGYSTLQFHPDGILVGTGTTNGFVHIWDVKSRQKVATFDGLEGQVSSLSFSENGYYLGTSSGSHLVKLWDLRKLSNFHTIELDSSVKQVTRVGFDYSGQYFGVAYGNNLSVYLNKQFNHLLTLSNHSNDVTDFAFGRDSRSILTVGMDRKLVISGKSE